jgi:hypothetical protein
MYHKLANRINVIILCTPKPLIDTGRAIIYFNGKRSCGYVEGQCAYDSRQTLDYARAWWLKPGRSPHQTALSVPTYDKFIEPILWYLAGHRDGAPAREVHDAAAAALDLTDADRGEILPSGIHPVYKNRPGWAHDRLKRVGYSASPRRGSWKLTQTGEECARTLWMKSPRATMSSGVAL